MTYAINFTSLMTCDSFRVTCEDKENLSRHHEQIYEVFKDLVNYHGYKNYNYEHANKIFNRYITTFGFGFIDNINEPFPTDMEVIESHSWRF